jgi:hypothetical protein
MSFPDRTAACIIALHRQTSRTDTLMCFSATANFVGSAALAAVGVPTLTRVRHRRELLFASLPTLFAVHQFIEGLVWLGLDGILSPKVTHNMGAAFMLYAQGLLPFLLPLSVMLFEPDKGSRMRMRPFPSARHRDGTLYSLGSHRLPDASLRSRQ